MGSAAELVTYETAPLQIQEIKETIKDPTVLKVNDWEFLY